MYRSTVMFGVLITMIIAFAFTNHHGQSKVITVNNNGGNKRTKCCVKGECICSSLSSALRQMSNDTIINITSEAITIRHNIDMGNSSSLNNITITSHTATVTCNNSKAISCLSCDNVTISGITWVGCSLKLINNSFVVNCTLKNVSLYVSGSSRNKQLSGPLRYMNITISESTVYSLTVSDLSCSTQWNIAIINSTLTAINPISFTICADVLLRIYMMNINVRESRSVIQWRLTAIGDVSVSVLSSVFIGNIGNTLTCVITNTDFGKLHSSSVLISDTEFINNRDMASAGSGPGSVVKIELLSLGNHNTSTFIFIFNNINFTNNHLHSGTLALAFTSCVQVNMTNVNFIGNVYFKDKLFDAIAAVYMKIVGSSNILIFNHCNFMNNTFSQGTKALYINEHASAVCVSPHNQITISNCSILYNEIHDGGKILYFNGQSDYDIQISNTVFKYNLVNHYIIVIVVNSVEIHITASNFIGNNVSQSCILLPQKALVVLKSSQFINNIGHCMSLYQANVFLTSMNFTGNIGACLYLLRCNLFLNDSILFDNNLADKGAAIYMDQRTNVSISDGSTVQFSKNSALVGGAIFVDLSVVCLQNGVVFYMTGNAKVSFNDNVARARYSGDALYFSISKDCKVNINTSDPTSMMHIPYRFNYSQVNFTSCCDISCSHLHDTGFPVVTSPHYLILCGNNVKQLDDVTYFISNTVLGKPVIFKAGVMDYFKKLSQPVQFDINCTGCPNEITLCSDDHYTVDNASPLNLTFTGKKKNFVINIIVTFTSFVLDAYIQPIEVQVIVELVPCFNHIGYAYSKESNGCACYHVSVVKCNDGYNEIEDGYWIGVISSQPTTSLCPAHYCSFIHRNKFTLGYSELPDTVDAQCSDHRTGTACGQCSSGYTLAYDTTDCISENDCSTIITVVVIISTCLYWLIVVVGVFTLLYYNRRIPLGYTYGIIYYYSMVGILFSNNFYVSESAFLFISVLSSFTQLSPQFLGKLCLVKGLSGIDQLFIHYVHPVAVSLLVVAFVIAAKFSPKLSAFVSRCRIIRIICLLLLLSYTSIASTSLQLLRPLTFTDIPKLYTYTSPSIQYFHDRHALYGTVAIVSELIVGIGLPLLLLLEPFVNKKINFIKIKPLLDQFQGCYKDKYRWFACYYLICRQVILLIVFVLNSDYDRMLYYLQTACVVIATIHAWIQPYNSLTLNRFDAVILQIMVLSVSVNIFAFLQPAATELVVVLIIFPLLMACFFVIRNVIYWLANRRRGQLTDDNEVDIVRFVSHH